MAKNKIDIQYLRKQYPRIKSVHRYGKRALGKSKLTTLTIQSVEIHYRAMQQKIMLASMNSGKKKKSYPDLINSYKKSRWNNDKCKSSDVVAVMKGNKSSGGPSKYVNAKQPKDL
jgi:hypothetical protein